MRSTPNHIRLFSLALLAGVLLAAPSARAQGDPASQGGSAGAGQDAQTPDTTATQNAPGPIGGVEQYQLGAPSLGHSFVVPRLSLQEVYDSNSGYASSTGAAQQDAITSLTGGVNLQLQKRNSSLALDYAAIGLIYDLGTQSNSVAQQFGLTGKYTVRRWNFVFSENLSYLPNTQFGLGGLGYITSGGATALNPAYQSTGTIGTQNVYQLQSSTAVQATYAISARSSLSMSGSAGFLHYFGDDLLLDTRTVTAHVGFDRTVTARDTLNLSYTASIQTYPSDIQGFYSQYIQAGYRRLVTGRLYLSVSGGPVITHFDPQNGQTTVQGSQNTVDMSAAGTLTYLLRRGSINVQYTRQVTGGSGVLVGATSDQVTGNYLQQFGRAWTASFFGSFARNASFQQTAQAGMMPLPATNATFNYWSAGASVSRPIGRYSTIRFSYNAQEQTANTTMCVNGVQCGAISLIQVIGVSFNWTTRPYKLD
jgi:hypothetical protein